MKLYSHKDKNILELIEGQSFENAALITVDKKALEEWDLVLISDIDINDFDLIDRDTIYQIMMHPSTELQDIEDDLNIQELPIVIEIEGSYILHYAGTSQTDNLDKYEELCLIY